MLWVDCQNNGEALPVKGAILDQPHILLMCFRIIFNEKSAHDRKIIHKADEAARIAEMNKRLQQSHEQHGLGKVTINAVSSPK